MKTRIKAINTIFLLVIFTIFSSCNSQNTSKDKTNNQNKTLAIGEAASQIDEGISVIYQDKNDHYWFASNDKGVYKYDGKNLILFTEKDGLCSHSIVGIQEDQFGNIYFDTHTGVCKFDGHQFTTLELINSDSSKNEWKLEPNDLWFRMGWDKSGPYRYDGKYLYALEFPKTDREDKFYAQYPNASYNPYGIYNLYQDSKGILWFGTASLGVCRYDGTSISWLYEKHLTNTPGGGDYGIRSIIEDKDGYFWFCNTRYRYEISPEYSKKNGTNHISYQKKDGVGYSDANNEVNYPYFASITNDNNGHLWMASFDEGVWRNDGQQLTHYPIKDGDTDILLSSIYNDNHGVLWLVTQGAGVYKYDGNSFKKFELSE